MQDYRIFLPIFMLNFMGEKIVSIRRKENEDAFVPTNIVRIWHAALVFEKITRDNRLLLLAL